jgi:soluble lytic murein transglycosylase-like protein
MKLNLTEPQKELGILAIAISLLLIVITTLHFATAPKVEAPSEPRKKDKINPTFYSKQDLPKTHNHDKNKIYIYKLEQRKEVEVIANDSFYNERIPLEKETQEYIWELANEKQLDPTLILAIAKVESNFNPNAVSSTGDYGLLQINKPSGTMKWLAKKAEIKNFDWSNPKHSVKAAGTYLGYLKSYYEERGWEGEALTKRVLLAYNRGQGGSNKYINKYGHVESTYVKKIMKQKELIESGEI